MFSGLINEEVHENVFWPDLPYVTDEHGSKIPSLLLYCFLPSWLFFWLVDYQGTHVLLSFLTRYILSGEE